MIKKGIILLGVVCLLMLPVNSLEPHSNFGIESFNRIRFDKKQDYGSGTDWSDILYRDKGYSICSDSRGRVYVADREDCKVHIFDEEGKLLKSFGQRGEGPGDFQYPNRISVYQDKFLIIREAMFYRSISVHSLDGGFIRKFRPEYAPKEANMLSEDGLIFSSSGMLKQNGKMRQKTRLLTMTENQCKEFRVEDKPCEYFYYLKNGGNIIEPEINFSGDLFFTVLPQDEIVVGDSDTDTLEFFDNRLNPTRKITLNLRRPRVKTDYFEKCKKKVIQKHKKKLNQVPGMLNAFKKWDVDVEQLPYYRKLKVTPEGNIVLLLNDPKVFTREQKITMYSKDGTKLYENTIDTRDYDLDYNSYQFFENDLFAFTSNHVYALLPVIDDEENTYYRVFKSKLRREEN